MKTSSEMSVSVDNEELVTFWSSSASDFGSRNILNDSSIL